MALVCRFELGFVEFDAVLDFAVVDFAVVAFVAVPLAGVECTVLALAPLPVFESAAVPCPIAGDALAHISTRAQPTLRHFAKFAGCFRFGSKGALRI